MRGCKQMCRIYETYPFPAYQNICSKGSNCEITKGSGKCGFPPLQQEVFDDLTLFVVIFQHAWASRYLLESLRKLSKKQIHDTRNNKKHHMIFLFLLFFQQFLSSKFLQDIGMICFATLFGQNKKQQYFLLKRFAILLTFKFLKKLRYAA